MNPNVINGVLRAVVPTLLAYAVGKGWITNDQVGQITAAFVTIAAAVWSIWTNWEKEHHS